MDQSLALLLAATLPVGAVHTLIGPDHYVPFIALSRSRNWSMGKTMAVTAACGLGHILSALVLGLGAAALGSLLPSLGIIESVRGSLAAWLLIGFGLAYGLWGLRQAVGKRPHGHAHLHAAGIPHDHGEPEAPDHEHRHGRELTPWVLFIIFILGPCEPLIPLILYPAAQASMVNVALVTLVFGAGTLAVMLAIVAASNQGLKRLARFPFFERFGSTLAGGIICACGLSIQFLGL
jgi:sulfite exporter TauE/SafE